MCNVLIISLLNIERIAGWVKVFVTGLVSEKLADQAEECTCTLTGFAAALQ